MDRPKILDAIATELRKGLRSYLMSIATTDQSQEFFEATWIPTSFKVTSGSTFWVEFETVEETVFSIAIDPGIGSPTDGEAPAFYSLIRGADGQASDGYSYDVADAVEWLLTGLDVVLSQDSEKIHVEGVGVLPNAED